MPCPSSVPAALLRPPRVSAGKRKAQIGERRRCGTCPLPSVLMPGKPAENKFLAPPSPSTKKAGRSQCFLCVRLCSELCGLGVKSFCVKHLTRRGHTGWPQKQKAPTQRSGRTFLCRYHITKRNFVKPLLHFDKHFSNSLAFNSLRKCRRVRFLLSLSKGAPPTAGRGRQALAGLFTLQLRSVFA